ncbi:MAG TPA: isochorismatase family cysteine hydrolase [Mycobacteriales bacterium]|nr:isochorismatase family cysteine hydrolase [Mycobacteriales bacterium]
MTDTALIVVDMFNSYRHADAEDLAASVGRIIEPLADIVRRARRRDDTDLIYVNDNYGDFTTDRDHIVRRALEGNRRDLVAPIVPSSECKFLLKVRHSAFYSTSLDYLLRRLGASRVILAGQVTEQCILYSALDAYIRHFDVCVPTDAVAHIDPDLGAAALKMMQRNMRAELVSAEDCLD